MANRPLIALDLGTSHIKGAVVDPHQMSLAQIRRLPFPDAIPGLPPLFFEIDPAEIMAAVRQVIRQLLPHAPGCAGLVMCGQMGGLVLATQQGQPLSNYISWRDQRLLQPAPHGEGTYFDGLCERLSSDEQRQLGREVRPGLPISYLYWLAAENRLPPAGAIACTLTDFVCAQLCAAAPAMHPSQAVGALNLETLDWHYGAFSKLGLDSISWPSLRDVGETVGLAEIDGFALPCYAPSGDHQAALAGVAFDYDELSINISTGSQVGLLSGQVELGNYQTRPFFDGRFINTLTHIPAGRSLNVLLGLITELASAQHLDLDDPWAYIEQASAAAAETDLAVDLAFFPSPVGQRGAIANISEANLTVGQLFYAAFRNMADNYYTCALRLSPQAAWHTLVFSGGLAQRLALLRQMITARLPGQVRLSAATEETLLGLLAIAMVISGCAPSVAAASATLRD
ncbi:MAG: FGGY family carbohydrate kinase, partial [Anaerolineales bacterium]